jgi:hypothetical protein
VFLEHLLGVVKLRDTADTIFREQMFPFPTVGDENNEDSNEDPDLRPQTLDIQKEVWQSKVTKLQNWPGRDIKGSYYMANGSLNPEIRQQFNNRYPLLQEGAPQSQCLQEANKFMDKRTLDMIDDAVKDYLRKYPKVSVNSVSDADLKVSLHAVTKSVLRQGSIAGHHNAVFVASDTSFSPTSFSPSLYIPRLTKLLVAQQLRTGIIVSASTLWSKVVARTDEIYLHNEAGYGLVLGMLNKLVLDLDATLSMAPLKDPVRIHEKALNDYENQFSDDVLPEACVLDVIRAKVSAETGEGLYQLLDALRSSKFPVFKGNVEGKDCQIELVRCKNKFLKPVRCSFSDKFVSSLLDPRLLA